MTRLELRLLGKTVYKLSDTLREIELAPFYTGNKTTNSEIGPSHFFCHRTVGQQLGTCS